MRNYEKPSIGVVEFDSADIIQTSGGLENDSNLNTGGMGGTFVPTSLDDTYKQ